MSNLGCKHMSIILVPVFNVDNDAPADTLVFNADKGQAYCKDCKIEIPKKNGGFEIPNGAEIYMGIDDKYLGAPE